MQNRLASLETTIKSELECIVKDAQKTLSGFDPRTIEYEISLIRSHLDVIQDSIDYENCISEQLSK